MYWCVYSERTRENKGNEGEKKSTKRAKKERTREQKRDLDKCVTDSARRRETPPHPCVAVGAGYRPVFSQVTALFAPRLV